MNGCKAIQTKLPECLDSGLSGHDMQQITAHLDRCRKCADEWRFLQQTQTCLTTLGPAPMPVDLLPRIQAAVNYERALRKQRSLGILDQPWNDVIGHFLLQAAGGFVSAVLLIGTIIVLVSMFTQPERAQATADEPLGMATAPRLLYLSSDAGRNEIGSGSSPVTIEVYVNKSGLAYDYRIVYGPNDNATRAQVENLLLTSRFEPARFFGQPVRGLVVLSFSGVSVRG